MAIQINIAKAEDIAHVATHLYVPDAVEIKHATNGMPVLDALVLSCKASHDTGGTGAYACYPVLDGQPDLPVAIFGCVAGNDDRGVLWMVTTPMLMGTSKDILHVAPVWIREWASRYPGGLHNLIHAGNKRHVKWLKRMGAIFDGAAIQNNVAWHHFVFPHFDRSQLLELN